MHARKGRLWGVLLALAVIGCARHGASPATTRAAGATQNVRGPATLEVLNNSLFDVRVFVVRAGQLIRMGTVTSMSAREFELSFTLIDREIRLYAEPIGSSQRQQTEAVMVRPGQQVSFRLDIRMQTYELSIF